MLIFLELIVWVFFRADCVDISRAESVAIFQS